MRWLLLSAVLLAVPSWADETPSTMNQKLRVRIKETMSSASAKAPEHESIIGGGEVLELEPMFVTGAMETDLLAEARRAAEAKKAAEFSLLRGGRLLSFSRGEIGFWPKLVLIDATPVK